MLKKYIRLDLCDCKKPHKNHEGFLWQEGSSIEHWPTRVVEEVTLNVGQREEGSKYL